MKEFAGDKQGAGKKDTGDAGGRAKDDSRGGQVLGFGGYGAGEGQVAPPEPMAAMRFGHMGAIRMAQSGGVDVTKHVGKSAKGGGGASGEVNSDIAGKVTASTEVDVGDVVIEEDPRLEEAGKSGVAKDAKTVAVKPDASDSTVAHELVHVVQMRGGSRVSGEGKTPDTEVSQAPEVLTAVYSGPPDRGLVDHLRSMSSPCNREIVPHPHHSPLGRLWTWRSWRRPWTN